MVTTMWMRTALGAALALGAVAGAARAQQTYPATLYWGTGLIDIPVAWVSPMTGDFALAYSGKVFETDPIEPRVNYNDRINSQLTFSLSAAGRLEAGIAFYSANPEYGFFGRGLLVREEDFQEGWGRWLVPSFALGARNVGSYQRIDRFGAGYQLLAPDDGSPNYRHVADSLHLDFNTAPTFYGVATKSFSLAEIRPTFPEIDVSLTLGYGTGLFEDDGNLEGYAKHGTGGLFYGVKTDFVPGPNLLVSLMAENNAWDFNLGASLVYRGLRAGLYLTEVGAGSASPSPDFPGTYLYGYQKVAFAFSWESNMYALLRGEVLAARADELRRQRDLLLAEIAARQQRIAALELEINRYEAQALLELEQRRAQAEAELRAEREALQRLEERLRRIEQQQPPPPPR